MSQLRHLSPRPTVIVDPNSKDVGAPAATSIVGVEGPFGRDRVLFALPIGGDGPVRLAAPVVLRDENGSMIAAMDDTTIGVDGVLVSRFLYASWTEDTRRIAG